MNVRHSRVDKPRRAATLACNSGCKPKDLMKRVPRRRNHRASNAGVEKSLGTGSKNQRKRGHNDRIPDKQHRSCLNGVHT